MHPYSSNCTHTTALWLIAGLSLLIAYSIGLITANWHTGFSWFIGPPAFGAVFATLYKLLDSKLWKAALIQKLGIVQERDISGTYEGQLISNYKGKTRRQVRLEITQSWTRLCIKMNVLDADSSTSYSIAGAYQEIGDGSIRIVYTYHNQPSPGIADIDMLPHDGTAQVVILHDGKLEGTYFNARTRQGSLRLNRLAS